MKRDLGKFTRNTNMQLIGGGILLLFIFGDGLIFFIYGAPAAIFGLLCMGIGFIPVILIYLVFVLLDWIVKNAHKEE